MESIANLAADTKRKGDLVSQIDIAIKLGDLDEAKELKAALKKLCSPPPASASRAELPVESHEAQKSLRLGLSSAGVMSSRGSGGARSASDDIILSIDEGDKEMSREDRDTYNERIQGHGGKRKSADDTQVGGKDTSLQPTAGGMDPDHKPSTSPFDSDDEFVVYIEPPARLKTGDTFRPAQARTPSRAISQWSAPRRTPNAPNQPHAGSSDTSLRMASTSSSTAPSTAANPNFSFASAASNTLPEARNTAAPHHERSI